MNIGYGIYGIFFGLLIMPRRRRRGLRMLLPSLAYMAALLISLGVSHCLNYQWQAWLFLMGMVAQFVVFLLLSWVVFLLRNIVRIIKP